MSSARGGHAALGLSPFVVGQGLAEPHHARAHEPAAHGALGWRDALDRFVRQCNVLVIRRIAVGAAEGEQGAV